MITHILKDGKKLKDISGHIVKFGDVPEVYNLMDTINKTRRVKKVYKDEKVI